MIRAGRDRREMPDAPVADWPHFLDRGTMSDSSGPAFLELALRFARPDGSMVFTDPGDDVAVQAKRWKVWQDRWGDPATATVLSWWFPPARKRPGGGEVPPLPAFSAPPMPLAVLRANWRTDGDLLAIDHRRAGPEGLLEVFGDGRRWLGPTWRIEAQSAGPARLTHWSSNPRADVAEWTFPIRLGSVRARVVRSAVLLRDRGLAFLGEEIARPARRGADAGSDAPPDDVAVRIALPTGVSAEPDRDARAVRLRDPGRGSAQVIAFGPMELGQDALIARRAWSGRRVFLPLLISWDPERNRRSVRWRTLTVTQRMKVRGPDVAFAARATWGEETFFLYRSLAKPALRAALGLPTKARFLVGIFNKDGKVEPLVKIN